MKRLRVWASVWLICLFALAACKEDDGYVYPSVLTEFIDARTDYSGTLFQLISDDGTVLSIRQRSGLDGLVKDTVYRTVSVYEREGDGEVYLYSAQLVLSMFPVTEDYFKDDIKTDPVGIRSIWQSGNYLNMILTPLVKDQNHAYHFVDYGIVENDGTKALRLGLYHDRNKDEEAFTREVYLSVPLWAYSDELDAKDSVFFQINTYGQGMTVYKFSYPEIKPYQ